MLIFSIVCIYVYVGKYEKNNLYIHIFIYKFLLFRYIDFVNLMSYDYHFYVWYYPITGLNAPLFSRAAESGYLSTLNVNFSVHYWLSKGMPGEKLIIGIPTYGHTYKLDNSLNHGLLAPANGFGKLGNMGFVSYPTVCEFLRNGAKSVFELESKVPYAYKDKEWISYDDITSIYYKVLIYIRGISYRIHFRD